MSLKTKISPQAPVYVLSIMEDDQNVLKQLRDKAWEEQRSSIVLKGFRKGKVPRDHAESIIGFDNLYESAIKELVTQACIESTEKIVGLGQVYIDVFGENQPTVIRAEVWLEPTVHLYDGDKALYKDLTVEVSDIEVDDSEVEAVLQRMRESVGVMETVDRESQEGDVLTIDFEGKLEDGSPFQGNTAEDYRVLLGSGTLLKEFEQQLVGLKADLKRTVNITITFPEGYHNKDLATKKATFVTTVKDVSKRDLPDLDDDFAKEMSYESLADAREKVKTDLKKNKEQQSKLLVDNQLLMQLVQSVTIDPIPECMINSQIENNVQTMLDGAGLTLEEYLKRSRLSREQLIAQQRHSAATDVRAKLILKAIASNEGIEATEEEKENLLKVVLPDYANKDKETIEKEINFDTLTMNIRVQKALEYVREHANLVEKPEGPTVSKETVDLKKEVKEVSPKAEAVEVNE